MGAFLPDLRRSTGCEGWVVHYLRQVHGTCVVQVGGREPNPEPEAADALITAARSVLLVTRHADCPPVLLWDPETPAVGLVHAGRRGTLANVAAATLLAMEAAYGSRSHAMTASVGPGIRACCYEIKEDVLQAPRSPSFGTATSGSTSTCTR